MKNLIPALKKDEALIAEMDSFLHEKKAFVFGGWAKVVTSYNGTVNGCSSTPTSQIP